ncbi:hypothetical protein IMAU80100_02467 [Lactiplantibacillus plantarum]|uniref:CopG family transcriptional regulator n=1 Tax=Lactiplantibacillus pentosus TaxID=1589 RepID=A0ABX5D327_LACPE|nr:MULTISPECIES: hypothetical protein [Lactiplantibacillus]ALG27433.1 hypothetical protein AN634_15845 [Lactiplantibacillus plantarum]MBU7514111.1 hypothetical protein [Lactiplantibacillus pentosus]MCG0557370.1 hypothetical protein [Lactiplantibacillus plantarum]MCG0596413.1 hypothetical protein [Lactiplantibacillus plantarum]MCG0637608.1 hypothetical protein [Lactiplantibacillus plantarum]
MSSRRLRNIDIKADRERFEKAQVAFQAQEAALQKEVGRLLIEAKGFTSTKQVEQWLSQLKERGL